MFLSHVRAWAKDGVAESATITTLSDTTHDVRMVDSSADEATSGVRAIDRVDQ
jgi:hypothetical protein